MRVVLLGPASPWRGGIAHFNDLLAREIALRHEIDVLTFTRQYPRLLFPGQAQEHPGEAALDVGAVRVLTPSDPGAGGGRRATFAISTPTCSSCATGCPSSRRPSGRWSAARRAGDDPRWSWWPTTWSPTSVDRFDSLLTRYALAPIDRFVVMSDSVHADLQRLRPGAPVEVVPHPLYGQFGDAIAKDEARRRLGLSDDARVLLFFGFIRQYKGLDVLLRAMARWEDPSAILLVVGEFYEDESRYRDLVRDLGIESRVRFVAEYVANDQVAPYFGAADVVTLPYRHATQSGIIPVAYHLDRPVICTDVGGLGEIVRHEHSGFLVPPEDPDAFAAALQRFYAENWEDRLTDGVRAEKGRYTWERFARAVLGENDAG